MGLQICYGAVFLLEDTSQGSSEVEEMFIDAWPWVPRHWVPPSPRSVSCSGREAWTDCRGGSIFFKVCRKLMVGGAVMKINEGALPGRLAWVLTDAVLWQAWNAFGLAQTSRSPASIPRHSRDGASLCGNCLSSKFRGLRRAWGETWEPPR